MNLSRLVAVPPKPPLYYSPAAYVYLGVLPVTFHRPLLYSR